MLSATIATTAWLTSRIQNQFTTATIVAAQGLLVFGSAWVLMGVAGVVFVALMAAFVASRASQQPLPTLRSLGAMALHPYQAPALYELVHALCARAGIPLVPLFLIPDPRPNAIATGDDAHGALAITTGLLDLMDRRQMAGILAHEISHLRQHDTRLQTLAMIGAHLVATLSNAALWLAILGLPLTLAGIVLVPWYAIFWLLLAAPASVLLGLWLSRTREFRADLEAVALTGDPVGLASALARLESPPRPALFRLLFPAWSPPKPPEHLSTHPHTAERIKRLLALSR